MSTWTKSNQALDYWEHLKTDVSRIDRTYLSAYGLNKVTEVGINPPTEDVFLATHLRIGVRIKFLDLLSANFIVVNLQLKVNGNVVRSRWTQNLGDISAPTVYYVDLDNLSLDANDIQNLTVDMISDGNGWVEPNGLIQVSALQGIEMTYFSINGTKTVTDKFNDKLSLGSSGLIRTI